MILVALTIAVCALVVAIVALLAALDARDFWRALLEDYRASRGRGELASVGRTAGNWSRPYDS